MYKNLKIFLKPNRKKIIVAIIISILFPATSSLMGETDRDVIGIGAGVFSVLIVINWLLSLLISPFSFHPSINTLMFFLFVVPLTSYILSCTLIAVWNKVKKK